MTGAEPRLRELTVADLPRLVDLERELFGPSAWSRSMLHEELRGPGRWYVGVEGPARAAVGAVGAPPTAAGTEVVAYAGLWFDGEVAQVMTIGVQAAAQRRGLGRRLLDALVERARGLGAEAVLLEVRVDNAAALALYESAGFTVLARRRRYYQPEDVDAFTMRLDLGLPHA